MKKIIRRIFLVSISYMSANVIETNVKCVNIRKCEIRVRWKLLNESVGATSCILRFFCQTTAEELPAFLAYVGNYNAVRFCEMTLKLQKVIYLYNIPVNRKVQKKKRKFPRSGLSMLAESC